MCVSRRLKIKYSKYFPGTNQIIAMELNHP